MAKLFFSRYSLVSGKGSEDKFELLLTGLANTASITKRGFVYQFFDATPFTHRGEEFIFGYLVKYDPNDMEEVVTANSELGFENLPNKVNGKARYIMYPAGSILMFCEVPRAISQTTFIDLFCELFEENHDNFFTDFNISPIKERYSFIERVKRYRAIKKIMITLFPSNPNSDDLWKDVDERLQRLGIDRYKETQENTTREGKITVDDETESKFLMAEDGYGHSRVSGIDENGNDKTISTNDKEKAVFEVVPPPDAEPPSQLLELVYSTLRNVIERTKK